MNFTISGARILGQQGLSQPSDVTVSDGLIAAITPTRAADLARDEEVVDVHGKILIPGLIDTHVHFTSEQDLVGQATNGVTTAIDLGTYPPSLVDSLRNRPGLTDIRSAGSAASAPGSVQSTVLGFPADSVVSSPDDAEAFVSQRVADGVDLIKIIVENPQVPTSKALAPESIAAIVEAAHARGLQTVAHATDANSYRIAVEAGVDIVTHIPLDRAVEDDVVQRMLDQGTIVSPTLVMMRRVVEAGGGPSRMLLQERAAAAGSSAPPLPPLDLEISINALSLLHAAGVPIIAGTDANEIGPFAMAQGAALHDELELLVRAGLTPLEALTAATRGAAVAVRLPDRGAIEPGLRADLVLLGADPTVDIGAVRSIEGVWVGGVPVDRSGSSTQ